MKILIGLLIAIVSMNASAGCPVIDGKFTRDVVEGSFPIELEIHTKVEGDKTSYSINDDGIFILADGKPHLYKNENGSGMSTITCGLKSIKLAGTSDDGKSAAIEVFVLNNNTLEIVGEGELVLLDGVYLKQYPIKR